MSGVTLSGSCLCGNVAYEVTGDPQNFFHCHCSRCRKSSGTGHASNIIMTGASLQWVSGQDRLAGYKAPKHIIRVERLERQANGKSDYRWATRIAEEALGV